MASITFKNIPPEVLAGLKQAAKQNGRSMNQEGLLRLRNGQGSARGVGGGASEAEIAALRVLHARQRAAGIWLTDEEITRAKREGRP